MNITSKISADLKLDIEYINRIVSRSRYYYKDYRIPKKHTGYRNISQPNPELKTLQYWVVQNILSKLPVSSSASAYQKGSSIKKHAYIHNKSKFLLHADISSFFPSIHPNHLEGILRDNKDIFDTLSLDLEESIDEINKICFKSDSLSIGAVSSPIISNIIMYSFDTKMMDYCNTHSLTYSRYADDIYISSEKYLSTDILQYLTDELEKQGFRINRSKTRFYSPKYRRQVTGLIITNNNQISIGTNRKKQIKKMIYDKLVHKIGDSDQILGYLSFLKDVEPHTYNNMIIKYSKYCSGDIIEEIRK